MFNRLKTTRDVPQIDDDKLVFAIGRLRLAPEDILVLTTPLLLDKEQVAAIRERAQAFVPNNTVMILTGDMGVGVITPDKKED